MTPSAFAEMLHTIYPDCRLNHVHPGLCQYEPVRHELLDLVARSGSLLTMEQIGLSVEGRVLSMVSAGTGLRRVLLWSQMHGDEPTATQALLDILQTILLRREEEWVRAMLRELTVSFIPLVNPDGAERWQRRNIAGVDINRDAQALMTPEGTALHTVRSRLRPDFGFNLHDQEVSSVGDSPVPSAIALLAPAPSAEKRTTNTRLRAMRVSALISRILEPYAHGRITRYEDVYEPRAYGETFQAAGTGTVLIESGHWPNDPQKAHARELNFLAILTALRSIANGSYEDTELDFYHQLPVNAKRMVDMLIRGVHLRHPSGWECVVDVGVMFRKSHDTVLIKDIGDLHTLGGLETLVVADRPISTALLRVDAILPTQELFDALQIYHPLPLMSFRP
jgi:hypothetical protein